MIFQIYRLKFPESCDEADEIVDLAIIYSVDI